MSLWVVVVVVVLLVSFSPEAPGQVTTIYNVLLKVTAQPQKVIVDFWLIKVSLDVA